MGCEYRMNVNRTLEYRGQKTVEVNIGDMNKVTHSYTVQYTITASGKLLPHVFICLQETQGKFGPTNQKTIDTLTNQYKNVYGSVQQKRATERARCLFRVKGALFNSLIIVCCVFEKKKQRTYIDRFFPALFNGAIVFIAKRFLPDENSS